MSSISTSGAPIQINYGSGLTPTEELLKQLGERSFLRFWSHANPYVEKGKELSDLIVVCGDFVIVFSEKNVTYNTALEDRVAWPRWFREAIEKSHKQLGGASRHLFKLRSQIYKDKYCSVPLGLPIPDEAKARRYRVAVVSRAKELSDPDAFSPFIMVDSSVVGSAHTKESATPFVVGDVSPSGDFVHVIDVAGLRAVLTELDTVTDFGDYLDSREAFIRGKQNNCSDSEWSMLARFMLSYDDQGEPIAMDAQAPGSTRLTRAEWDNDQFKKDLLIRRQANLDSRVWDALVERHAQMTERQSFAFTTNTTVEAHERVVRHMALENRLDRRTLGKRWLEACQIAGPEQASNIRTIPRSAKNGTTYVFLTVSNILNESDESYRGKRLAFLTEMMLASLVDVPDSLVVIGLASDLGVAPENYDHAFLDVVEHDGVQLRKDAQVAWEKKRKAFQPPVMSQGDEWSIPWYRTSPPAPAKRRRVGGRVLGLLRNGARKLQRSG